MLEIEENKRMNQRKQHKPMMMASSEERDESECMLYRENQDLKQVIDGLVRNADDTQRQRRVQRGESSDDSDGHHIFMGDLEPNNDQRDESETQDVRVLFDSLFP